MNIEKEVRFYTKVANVYNHILSQFDFRDGYTHQDLWDDLVEVLQLNKIKKE